MAGVTPQQWQDLYERTQQTARDLDKFIKDVENGYEPTAEEMAAFREAGAAVAAASQQLEALAARCQGMIEQAPNN